MSEEVEELKKTISQKDEMIAGDPRQLHVFINRFTHTPIIVMKTRTKDFVTKLKEEQAEKMTALTTQMQQKEVALMQELEAGKKAIKGLSDVKPILLDLKVRSIPNRNSLANESYTYSLISIE